MQEGDSERRFESIDLLRRAFDLQKRNERSK